MLARLLTPQDYGYVALVAVFVRFGILVAEGGIGNVIVLGDSLSDGAYRRLHGWSITFFLVAFILLVMGAVPIERLYDSQGIRWIVIAMAGGALLNGFTVVPVARMRRALRLRELSIFYVWLTISESVTAVVCAFLGFGYWSLVIGFLAGRSVFAVLVARAFIMRPALPSMKGLHKALADAKRLLVGQISTFLAESSDAWVGGFSAGTIALGGYSFMSGIAKSPLEKVSGIVMYVGGSALGSIRDDPARLSRALIRMIRIVALIMFPIFAGIVLVADDLVFALLGEKWLAYVPALQIYCVYAMSIPLVSILGTGVIAAGATREAAQVGLIRLLLLPPAFYFLGIQYGATGLALAWLLPVPLVFAKLERTLFKRIELGVRDILRALMRPLLNVAIMCSALLFLGELELVHDLTAPLRLGLKVLFGGLIFLAMMIILQRNDLRWLLDLVEVRSPGKAQFLRRLLRI